MADGKGHKSLLGRLKGLGRIFADTLYPEGYKCVVCGREIFDKGRYPVCDICVIEYNNKRICGKCGAPLKEDANGCYACKGSAWRFDKARSALIYEGNALKLIRGFKYGDKRYLAGYLGALIADEYYRLGFGADLIIAAPVSDKRRKTRGYNQSELLAVRVAELTGVAYDKDVLYKCEDVPYQARLTRPERLAQVKGIFAVNGDKELTGAKVILIDDVMTTGATIDELAVILKDRGAAEVLVLTAARSPVH